MKIRWFRSADAAALRRILEEAHRAHPWDIRWVARFEPEAYAAWLRSGGLIRQELERYRVFSKFAASSNPVESFEWVGE